VPDGKPLHTLRGEKSDCEFKSVAFSPDGATLAAGTDEPMVRLWRCADGKPLRILEEHKKWVTSLTFSPDGTFLASASLEMELRIWRVRDWESWSLGYVQSKADPDRKRNIAFSPDGALFAAGAQLWRVSDWKLTGTLEADEFEPAKVSSAVFSPDNELIATATWERNSWPFQAYAVQLWRVADKTILWRLTCDYSRPPCLAWSPDGSLLISVGKSIYLYSRLHH
jgi:WD40 repeat protein